MKERIKASLRTAFNAAKLRINGLRPFNAPAVRSNGSAFWTFPKPKNLEQWWWLFTIGAISVTFLYIVFFSIILKP